MRMIASSLWRPRPFHHMLNMLKILQILQSYCRKYNTPPTHTRTHASRFCISAVFVEELTSVVNSEQKLETLEKFPHIRQLNGKFRFNFLFFMSENRINRRKTKASVKNDFLAFLFFFPSAFLPPVRFREVWCQTQSAGSLFTSEATSGRGETSRLQPPRVENLPPPPPSHPPHPLSDKPETQHPSRPFPGRFQAVSRPFPGFTGGQPR